MPQLPTELSGAVIHLVAIVEAKHCPTGHTRHYVNGELLGPAAYLAIGQYENDPGFYLFYCDARWGVATYTWHRSLEAAKHQAVQEYEGIGQAWQVPPGVVS